MSAASSWMMSAALPPTKLVSSLSWTELTSTGTTETWIDAWLLFHESTIAFIAFTVVGCHTYVAMVTLVTLDFDLPAVAAEAARATHSTSAVLSPRSFFIEVPPFVGSALAFHGPGHEAARQPALDDGEEQEARERREQRARGERAEPHDSLDADEPRQEQRQGRQARALEEDEGQEELVPRRDEGEERRDDDAGREQRRDHGAEDGEAARAVDHRRLLDVARDPADVALQHPEDERQRPDDVDEDEAGVRVGQVQLPEQQEERDDDQDQREHLAEQDPAEAE